MICSQDVCLKEVAEQGHDFNWIRPRCACGGFRVWGHGRVSRYFEGYAAPLIVQRFRCFDCRRVFTCRPSNAWTRFRWFAFTIIHALISRMKSFQWPVLVPRQRGGHWLRRLGVHLHCSGGISDPLKWLAGCRARGEPPFPI